MNETDYLIPGPFDGAAPFARSTFFTSVKKREGKKTFASLNVSEIASRGVFARPTY